MARPDHTSTSRSLHSLGNLPHHPLGRIRAASAYAEEPQRRAAVLAGLAFANETIACLLDDANTQRDAHINGLITDPQQSQMLAETVHGLFTAVYFLNQYAETLLLVQDD